LTGFREISEIIQGRFQGTQTEFIEANGELTIIWPRETIVDFMTFMRDDERLRFDLLLDITGLDLLPKKPRFYAVYNIHSVLKRHRVRVRSALDEEEPEIDSVVSVWPAANWHERETYDMFGFRFKGHPDLTRILMPDTWIGHPCRKDYSHLPTHFPNTSDEHVTIIREKEETPWPFDRER
jgi:NADH-quinone oxidoreductase subunit C